MKKIWTAPALPVLLGAGLGLLRALEQHLVTEPDTGRLIPGHPMLWVFWLALAAAAVVTAVPFRPWKKEKPQLGDLRLAAPGDAAALGLTAAGLLVLLSGLADLRLLANIDPVDSVWRTFLLPKTVLAFPAGVALVLLAAAAKQGVSLKRRQLALLLPVFWAGLWAIYLLWYCSPDPAADSYLPEVLAVLTLGLSVSHLAGFGYDDAYPRRTRLLLRLGTMLAALTVVSAGAGLLLGSDTVTLRTLPGLAGLLGGAAAMFSCDCAIARTPEQGDAPEPPKKEEQPPRPEAQP